MPNLEQYYRKKLDELKAQPVKILALAYPYVLVVGLIIGLIYISNLNQSARTRVPAAIPDSTVAEDLKIVEPRVVPPVDIMTVSQSTPELLNQGKEVYNTVCQSCHGSEGKGDGPGAAGLNPSPRNFTNPDGWKNGPKISQIYRTLEEGIPGSAMVSYDYLLPAEKIGLAHYIRQSFIPIAPVDSEDELVTLDQTYQLSKGKEVPAQIPVAAAIEIISKENIDDVQKIVEALGKIAGDSNSEGARIFNQVAANKAHALTMLSRDNSWKGNLQAFIKNVAGNLVENGFNGNVYKLSSNEWSTLQNYLSRYL
jgi:mono/diheme cytochrome c family protein